MSKVIAVANQKGGVGKTTTAVNLSSCMHTTEKMYLFDIDPQEILQAVLASKRRKKSIYDVIINEESIDSCLLDTAIDTLKLCPSNIQLAGAEVELVPMISRGKVKTGINEIRTCMIIIVDCPPSGLLTVTLLRRYHSCTYQCEVLALEGLNQLMDTVKLVRNT